MAPLGLTLGQEPQVAGTFERPPDQNFYNITLILIDNLYLRDFPGRFWVKYLQTKSSNVEPAA